MLIIGGVREGSFDSLHSVFWYENIIVHYVMCILPK